MLFYQGEDIFFSLPGYDLLTLSRADTGSRGGGVGLYIQHNLNYRMRSDLSRMSDYIEVIVVEVTRKGSPNLLLVSAYRTQDTDVDTFNTIFDNLLKQMMLNNKMLILGCDLNIVLLKIDNHFPSCNFLIFLWHIMYTILLLNLLE